MRLLIFTDIAVYSGMAMCNRIAGLIIGIILGLAISVYAYRAPRPAKITKFDEAALTQLNTDLENLWNLSNGRYSVNIITSNPDGSLNGDVGDIVLFNNGGTYYLEVNTTGAKVWRGTALTDTP